MSAPWFGRLVFGSEADERWTSIADREPRLAVFFVRCPDPLGFPGAASLCIQLSGNLDGYGDVALHLDLDGSAPVVRPSPSNMFVSVRFHTGRRVASLFDSSLREGRSVVSSVVPAAVLRLPDGSDEAGSEADQWSTFTMAELVTPLAAADGDGVYHPVVPGEQAMAEAFERSVEVLFLIVRACRNALKLPLDTPSRERLGPEFFEVSRRAGAGLEAWDETGGWVINAESIPSSQPPLVDEAQVRQLTSGITMETTGHPAIGFTELRSEAAAALRHGDYRAAVMLYHTASEVLLDVTLMLMQWEEGKMPADLAELFKRPLLTRVRSEFPPRLGGVWDNGAGSIIDTWRKDLVLVRHRTIHGGFPVTPPAAAGAKKAHDALITHVFNRLAENFRKYPKTTGTLVAKEAFQRREKLSRAVETTIVPLRGESLQAFNAWRVEMTRLRMSE